MRHMCLRIGLFLIYQPQRTQCQLVWDDRFVPPMANRSKLLKVQYICSFSHTPSVSYPRGTSREICVKIYVVTQTILQRGPGASPRTPKYAIRSAASHSALRVSNLQHPSIFLSQLENVVQILPFHSLEDLMAFSCII